jgi:excinuclease ABC subunit C
MECFDISHTMGEATTASCVVFEKGLPKIKKYRQFVCQ